LHDPRDLAAIVADELDQLRTSGFDVTGIDPTGLPAGRALERLATVRRVDGWPYDEPDDPADILASLPAASRPTADPRPEELRDRIAGAWLGRCAGCALGKPIETWPTADIERYLRATDQWPPDDYLVAVDTASMGLPDFKPSWPRATRGRISGMPRDDDIDYTILGLHILESHGVGFSTDDVADELLDHLPFTRVYTAERVAYGNLVHGIRPPDTARHRNPYREWIGALIRADIFGLAAPGDPRRAAELALRDARLSHTGNGIYAAMWAAGAVSAAVAGASPREAVLAGLDQVPPGSRLHAAIADLVQFRAGDVDWEGALERIHHDHADYGWVHAVNNVAAIVVALLWGDGAFGRTVGLAVAAGWDTDSCAASAGSICGASLGRSRLPERWIAPLDDSLDTAIAGFQGVPISELVERTARLAL
jgi:ADP-ribosylglycohydrolase